MKNKLYLSTDTLKYIQKPGFSYRKYIDNLFSKCLGPKKIKYEIFLAVTMKKFCEFHKFI